MCFKLFFSKLFSYVYFNSCIISLNMRNATYGDFNLLWPKQYPRMYDVYTEIREALRIIQVLTRTQHGSA